VKRLLSYAEIVVIIGMVVAVVIGTYILTFVL